MSNVPLKDAKRSRKDANRSLKDAKHSLKDAKRSLKDAKRSLFSGWHDPGSSADAESGGAVYSPLRGRLPGSGAARAQSDVHSSHEPQQPHGDHLRYDNNFIQ